MALPQFPTAEVAHLRAAALKGLCPICGHGPWPSLGLHSARKHEIGARDLKAALGIPARTSLSSPSVRSRAREVGLTNPERTALLIAGGRTASRNADISEAGAQGKQWGLHKARVRSARARRKLTDEQVAEASARIDQGHRYADVGAELGVTASGLWYRVKQWRTKEAETAARTPGARPKPITLDQVLAAIAEHGSQVKAAKALGVSRNLIQARLAQTGQVKHPNAARDERAGRRSRPLVPNQT